MRRICRPLTLALGLALAVVVPAFGAVGGTSTETIQATKSRTVSTKSIIALAQKSDDTDTQWLSDGIWHMPDMDCWYCATGPGTLSATLWRVEGHTNKNLLNAALNTFDTAIAQNHNPDGSFGDETAPDTQFFGVELGTAYLMLGDSLDAAHQASWKAAITSAADYLISNHELTYATNGNIDIGEAEFEWMAWAITGQPRFHDAFKLAFQNAVHPDPTRFPGYGIHMTKPATSTSVGAGYLAENGGAGPGFDPEYTMLQLTVVARAYLLSNDPDFLWLLKVLYNQLSPLVSTTTWEIDAQGGTRKSHVEPFATPGLIVLALDGGLEKLRPLVTAQANKGIYNPLLQNALRNWGNEGYYRDYGNTLAPVVLALTSPPLQPPSAALGKSPVSTTSGKPAGPRSGQTLRVKALYAGGKVSVSWKGLDSPAPRSGLYDVVVDGELVQRAKGLATRLRLATGLHQITVTVDGARGATTPAIVTVPAG